MLLSLFLYLSRLIITNVTCVVKHLGCRTHATRTDAVIDRGLTCRRPHALALFTALAAALAAFQDLSLTMDCDVVMIFVILRHRIFIFIAVIIS
jgi:hypothetical protein